MTTRRSQASADPPEHLREREVPREWSHESPNAAAWPTAARGPRRE